MEKFNLVIKPAVPAKLRYDMIRFLEKKGYELIGSGEFLDKSSCDISFYKKETKIEPN